MIVARRAGLEGRQRLELAVLRLLDVRIDRPPVRAPVGVAELHLGPVDHVVGERAAELVGVHVRLRGRVPHEIREQPLDDPVLAHDLARTLRAGRGEDRLLVLAALDEPFGLQALQHLARRGAGDAEHLGDARGDRL